MRRQLLFIFLVSVSLAGLLGGCGGGGGGGGGSSPATATISGVIVDVSTNTAPSPAALVSAGSASATTDSSGNFMLSVSVGTTQISVNREDGNPPFVFTIAATPSTGEDVGTLFIGPSRVTITGTAADSSTLNPIVGATASIDGIFGSTDASGHFSLAGVPYSNAATSAFSTLPGVVAASGYISGKFQPGTSSVTNSSVNVGTVTLISSSDPNPPNSPYNIWGRVSPLASSPGASVTLNLNGTAYRTTTVGSDGTYTFWVPAGSYTLVFSQTGFVSQTESVTLTQPNQVVEEDVTLVAG